MTTPDQLQYVQHVASSARYTDTDAPVCLTHAMQLILQDKLSSEFADGLDFKVFVLADGVAPECVVCDLLRAEGGPRRVSGHDALMYVLHDIHRYAR